MPLLRPLAPEWLGAGHLWIPRAHLTGTRCFLVFRGFFEPVATSPMLFWPHRERPSVPHAPPLSARPVSRLLLAFPQQPRLWVLVLLQTCLLWRATSPSGPLTSLRCAVPACPCCLSPHWPLPGAVHSWLWLASRGKMRSVRRRWRPHGHWVFLAMSPGPVAAASLP